MTESPDEDYRRAAVDLLGAIAYGELSAFERLAADAAMAPDIFAQAPGPDRTRSPVSALAGGIGDGTG